MKKFLFVTLPSNDLGLLAQSLPIANELRNRGHQVTFSSPAFAPGKVISRAGFPNIRPKWPLYTIMSGDTRFIQFLRMIGSRHIVRDFSIFSSFVKHIKQYSTSEIWDIDHFTYLQGLYYEKYVLTVLDTLLKVIQKSNPDYLVNFWNPFLGIVAKITKIPMISVIQADIHPQSHGFIWWKTQPSDLPNPVPAINKVLNYYRLPSIQKTGDLFIGDLTLVLGMPETDPLPEGLNVTYIGSMVMPDDHQHIPEWMDNLGSDLPVIWIYPGNLRYLSKHDSPFDGMVILKACIEALGDMKAQVVLTTGYHPLPQQVLPLPSNFRSAEFVPGLSMAERSNLVIHHGGYGSGQTCLYAGTPSVVVPTFSERESNARRLMATGASELVIPVSDSKGLNKQVNPIELQRKVEQVLTNSNYKINAEKISKRMKTYGGSTNAANIIETFIRDLGDT